LGVVGNRYAIQDYRLFRSDKTTYNPIESLSALRHAHAGDEAVFLIGSSPDKPVDLVPNLEVKRD
jgi:hypothetical protein